MKVIIADDEKKVCNLIHKLIQWDKLGMEFAGFAHNGEEALALIDEVNPDIAITDIRMPGMDGLEMIRAVKETKPAIEFVVVSGFRQFEYAQEALKQGVSNYLLKPINDKELNHTLEIIKGRLQKKSYQSRIEIEDRHRTRQKIITEYVLKNQDLPKIATLNQDYYYQFQPGHILVAVLKFDGVLGPQGHFHDKIAWALKEYLGDCNDFECLNHDNRYVLLVNSEQNPTVNLKRVVKELSQDSDIFTNFSITVGAGIDYKTASYSLSQRLFQGGNQVISAAYSDPESVELGVFSKEFIQYVEFNEKENLLTCAEKLLKETAFKTGDGLLLACRQILQLYALALKKFHYQFGELNQQELIHQLDNFVSANDIINHLINYLSETFQSVLDQRENAESKPITEAKKYINANFTEPITLEEVSQEVGFSSAYFSTMFKDKTGMSFTDYLFNKRMEEAKRQLRDTNNKVSDICENIGYLDLKHFNKGFKKSTGLKPTEYRKLYS